MHTYNTVGMHKQTNLHEGNTRAVELGFKNLGFLGFFKKPKKPKNPNLGFLGFLILLFYFNLF